SLADLYGRLQNFCWEQINQGLLSGRTRLLERATRLPVERLEREVRLFAHASALHPPEQVEAYLEAWPPTTRSRALALPPSSCGKAATTSSRSA
ncbi:MAG: hypothetical protein RMK65_05990, partial [Anaerolineae bacterium]|nr:hypothetical protein [Anaerolineae bacterium]